MTLAVTRSKWGNPQKISGANFTKRLKSVLGLKSSTK